MNILKLNIVIRRLKKRLKKIVKDYELKLQTNFIKFQRIYNEKCELVEILWFDQNYILSQN